MQSRTAIPAQHRHSRCFRAVAVVSLVAFSSYSTGLAQQATPSPLQQTVDRVAELNQAVNALNRRLDEMAKQTQFQNQVLAKTTTAQPNAAALSEAQRDAAVQIEKLTKLRDEARTAGQHDLEHVLDEALEADGGLQKLMHLSKETSADEVEKIIRQTKGNAEELVKLANDTLDSFRNAVRDPNLAGPLKQIKTKALTELQKASDDLQKKVRERVRTYLPPDLQRDLDQEPNLTAFVQDVLEKKQQYPELAFDILQTLSPNGQLDANTLGVADGPQIKTLLKDFQEANLSHDAATQMSSAASSIMTMAMMTGNPWVMAGAAILVALMFIFGGKGEGKGEGKGDGKGPGGGDRGADQKPSIGPNHSPGPTADPNHSPSPTGTAAPSSTNVPGNYAATGYEPVEQADGSLQVSKGKLKNTFTIPKKSMAGLTVQLVTGKAEDPRAELDFTNWKSLYIDSINYDADSDTLSIGLGGPKAAAGQKPVFLLNQKKERETINSLTLVIIRKDSNVAVTLHNPK